MDEKNTSSRMRTGKILRVKSSSIFMRKAQRPYQLELRKEKKSLSLSFLAEKKERKKGKEKGNPKLGLRAISNLNFLFVLRFF